MLDRTPFAEPLLEIAQRFIPKIKERDGRIKYPMFLKSLNDITLGFPEKPTIISARTSHGKTAFMLNCALFHALKCDLNVLFLSLEDTKESIIEKILCNIELIGNYDLKKGNHSSVIPDRFYNKLNQENFFLDDSNGFNIQEIISSYNFTIFKNGRKADIIYWDYLQIIDDAGYDAFNAIMRDIRTFTKTFSIPFVIGCQQNRVAVVGKDKAPTNATTKGSGSIEEVAELMLLLYYPYQVGVEEGKYDEDYGYKNMSDMDKNTVKSSYFEVSVSKNKTGMCYNKLPVEYYGKHYLFRDWTSPSQIIENYKHGFEQINQFKGGF